MTVRVKLFAVARERAGCPFVDVELPASATVAQLRGALIGQFPSLAAVVPHVRFAINSEYAGDGAAIPPAAEVAIIPPVSGG